MKSIKVLLIMQVCLHACFCINADEREELGRVTGNVYRDIVVICEDANLIVIGQRCGGRVLFRDDKAMQWVSRISLFNVKECFFGTSVSNICLVKKGTGWPLDFRLPLKGDALVFLRQLTQKEREEYLMDKIAADMPAYWVLGGRLGCYELAREGPEFKQDIQLLICAAKEPDIEKTMDRYKAVLSEIKNESILKAIKSNIFFFENQPDYYRMIYNARKKLTEIRTHSD